MEHDRFNILMIFDKLKIDNFDTYNVLLAITTNIPMLLMTGFMVQGHKCVILWGNNVYYQYSYLQISECCYRC